LGVDKRSQWNYFQYSMSALESQKYMAVFRFWRPGMENQEQVEVVDLRTKEVIRVTLERRGRGSVGLRRQDSFAPPLEMTKR